MTIRRGIRWLCAALLLGTAGAISGHAPAEAAPNFPDVTVRLTVLELEDLGDDLDSTSDADFYTIVGFDDHAGTTMSTSNEDTDETEEVEGEEHIFPNWESSFVANPSKGSVAVELQVKDEDGGLNFDDDTAEVHPGGSIRAEVDLRPCRIVIDAVDHVCGQPITFSGGDKVRFKIDVLFPTSTPGLRIQCLQQPLLPKPGQTVTITATALDGAANALRRGRRTAHLAQRDRRRDVDRRAAVDLRIRRHLERVLVRVHRRGPERFAAGDDHPTDVPRRQPARACGPDPVHR